MSETVPCLATREDVVNDIVAGVEAAQIALFGMFADSNKDADALVRLAVVNARPKVARIIDASITDAHVAAYIRHKSDPDMQDFTRKAAQFGEVVGAVVGEEIKKLV